MCHAKADGYAFGGPNCMFLDSCSINGRCVTAGSCEARGNPSAAFFDLNQAQALNRPPVAAAKPEVGTLPGFDSEAHRSFMRGLG